MAFTWAYLQIDSESVRWTIFKVWKLVQSGNNESILHYPYVTNTKCGSFLLDLHNMMEILALTKFPIGPILLWIWLAYTKFTIYSQLERKDIRISPSASHYVITMRIFSLIFPWWKHFISYAVSCLSSCAGTKTVNRFHNMQILPETDLWTGKGTTTFNNKQEQK